MTPAKRQKPECQRTPHFRFVSHARLLSLPRFSQSRCATALLSTQLPNSVSLRSSRAQNRPCVRITGNSIRDRNPNGGLHPAAARAAASPSSHSLRTQYVRRLHRRVGAPPPTRKTAGGTGCGAYSRRRPADDRSRVVRRL